MQPIEMANLLAVEQQPSTGSVGNGDVHTRSGRISKPTHEH